jgi:hypothetical protein
MQCEQEGQREREREREAGGGRENGSEGERVHPPLLAPAARKDDQTAGPMRTRLAPPGCPCAKKRGNFSIARSLNNGTEVTRRHRRERAEPRERVNASIYNI